MAIRPALFDKKEGIAMSNAGIYLAAFLMGGLYCAIGQVFLMFWSPLVAPEHAMAATLLSMGALGVVMYIAGVHQKLAAKTGWGSILVFNGYACALADAFERGAEEGGMLKGIVSLADLLLWVTGTGILLSIVVSVAAFFMA